MCWSFGVVGLEWYPCCTTKNNTTNVVIQQNSRRLLMMDILMSKTCWAHKKWNKIASDIKLVFYSSTITMMHGPINIRFTSWIYCNLGLSVLFPNSYSCKVFSSFCGTSLYDLLWFFLQNIKIGFFSLLISGLTFLLALHRFLLSSS